MRQFTIFNLQFSIKREAAIVLFILLILAGCTPLDKKNPTDPQATNYIGMHYIGTISDPKQKSISDICFFGTDIFVLDESESMVFRYKKDGQLRYNFYNGSLAYPSGAAADSSLIYIVDKDSVVGNIKIIDPAPDTPTVTAYPATNPDPLEKCAVTAGFIYVSTETNIYKYALPGVTPSVFTVSGSPAFFSITDIEIGPGNEIVVADSILKKIIILDSSGAFMREYSFAYNIEGIGISNGYIYIPSDDGIHKIDFNTGTQVLKFADYGDGNGRISAPGPCEASGSRVCVGEMNIIKVFEP